MNGIPALHNNTYVTINERNIQLVSQQAKYVSTLKGWAVDKVIVFTPWHIVKSSIRYDASCKYTAKLYKIHCQWRILSFFLPEHFLWPVIFKYAMSRNLHVSYFRMVIANNKTLLERLPNLMNETIHLWLLNQIA